MYLNLTVPMPSEKGKLTTKTIKNTPYVYYEISRTYDSDKKYNSPKCNPRFYSSPKESLSVTLSEGTV